MILQRWLGVQLRLGLLWFWEWWCDFVGHGEEEEVWWIGSGMSVVV